MEENKEPWRPSVFRSNRGSVVHLPKKTKPPRMHVKEYAAYHFDSNPHGQMTLNWINIGEDENMFEDCRKIGDIWVGRFKYKGGTPEYEALEALAADEIDRTRPLN